MVDIEKIEKRTVQSFYEDGLAEIGLGLIVLLLGGYFFAKEVVPANSSFRAVLNVLFIFVIVFGFLANRILRFFKRRISYPRTGYVTFKKKELSPKRRIATAVVAAIISASLAALYSLSPSFKALYPAVNGLLFGVAGLLFANKVGLMRFYVLAALSAVIGVAVTAAGIGDIKGIFLYYAFFGTAMIISGLAALVVYLRRSPRPAADASEGPDAH
jgi:Na+-transporting methylmalonyl-CoA/oxaloacetate decarboxylase gamma subunit